MPKIALIATGGTIASKLDSNKEYISGTTPIDSIFPNELLSGIKIFTPFSVDSSDIDSKKLLKLTKLIKKLCEKFDAIIITHGTDSMCESAFFAYLTIDAKKPIIFTGAMRSSTDLEFDGIENFKFALKNIDKQGVFIAMNNKLINAKDAIKKDTLSLDAFDTKPSPNIPQGVFDIPKKLPKCAILYAYAGDDCFVPRASNVVYAGLGNGTIPSKSKLKLINLAKKGKIVVRASICQNGCITTLSSDIENGFIACGFFNLLQARIVVMLADTKSLEFFKRYAYEI